MNYFTVPGLLNTVYPVVANTFLRTIGKPEPGIKYTISEHVIMTAVCDAYQIPIEKLLAKTRKRTSVEPRHVCYYLLKFKTEMKLSEIGDLFNGINHSSVIHGIKATQCAIDTDSVMGNMATKLMQQL